MAELLLIDDGINAPAVWRTVHIAPWNGDVRLKLRPSTKGLLDYVTQKAKENPLHNRHYDKNVGKTVDGDPAAAWNEEFAVAVVDDWDGVAGNADCSDDNKRKIASFNRLMNFISAESGLMAGVESQDEEKNSKTS